MRNCDLNWFLCTREGGNWRVNRPGMTSITNISVLATSNWRESRSVSDREVHVYIGLWFNINDINQPSGSCSTICNLPHTL